MDKAKKTIILNALRYLNWNYGRGDIRKVDYVFCRVLCVKQYGWEWRKFRVADNKVTFRGHTKKI